MRFSATVGATLSFLAFPGGALLFVALTTETAAAVFGPYRQPLMVVALMTATGGAIWGLVRDIRTIAAKRLSKRATKSRETGT
jgi:hypothetical protein